MNQKREYNSLKSIKNKYALRFGLLAILICLGAPSVQAKTIFFNYNSEALPQLTITGTIVDDTGVPLPGAVVVVKGTNNGAQADFDGNYSIDANTGDTLVFSYIGYLKQEVVVGNDTVINITMTEDAQALDEVVVVAYGTSTKKDLTGAVSVVGTEELNSFPATNVDQALQGKTAGVQIVSNSGAPGSSVTVNIRGVGSFANTTPLYIVDGYPTQDISFLNPNSIASMSVLKDASAGAIYGVRASNGVVIIETKKGTKGKVSVELNTFVGYRFQPKTLDVLDIETFAPFATEIGNSTDFTSEDAVPFPGWANPGQLTNIDWQDFAYNSAARFSTNLSVRGGGENSRMAFTAGIYDEDGVVLTSEYKRYNMGLNAQFDVTDKLRINVNSNYAYSSSIAQLNQGYFNIARMIDNIPHLAGAEELNARGFSNGTNLPFDGNGNFGGFPDIPENTFRTSSNVLASALQRDGNNGNNNFYGNLDVSYDFFDGLTASAKMGVNTNSSFFTTFNPTFYRSNSNNDVNDVSTYDFGQRTNTEWLFEGLLKYKKTFAEKHNIDVLLGVSAQRDNRKFLRTTGSGFLNNEIRDLSQSNEISISEGNEQRTTLASTFARLNYNFNSKYYITGTIRRDGVGDRFGQNEQFGIFPSFAGGWNIDEESFMDDSVFDILKIRGSWGETGSFIGINPFSFAAIFGNGSPRDDAGTNGLGQGLFANNLANPDLRWETQRQTDVGLEAELFNRSVYLTVDYYNKESSDFLFNETIPIQNGFTSRAVNAGNVVNKGFEILAGHRKTSGDFTWDISANITTVDNEITALTSTQDFTVLPTQFVPQFNTRSFWADLTRSEVGGEVGSYFAFRADGIFNDQAELDALNATAVANGNPAYQDVNTSLGDRRFKDISGPDGTPDGVINEFDREIIGSPIPDFYGGLNMNFKYKGFDLGVDFYGSYGGDILNFVRLELESLGGFGLNDGFSNVSRDFYNNRWTPDNPSNTYARAIVNDAQIQNGRASDYFLEDGSFLRLRNVRLGYSLPTDFSNSIGMENINIYVSGQNLITWTNYTGYDPEIGQNSDIDGVSSVGTRGIDAGAYPITKSMTMGVNMKF